MSRYPEIYVLVDRDRDPVIERINQRFIALIEYLQRQQEMRQMEEGGNGRLSPNIDTAILYKDVNEVPRIRFYVTDATSIHRFDMSFAELEPQINPVEPRSR